MNDWFYDLTGFREGTRPETLKCMERISRTQMQMPDGRVLNTGILTTPTLRSLLQWGGSKGFPLRLVGMRGDVAAYMRDPANAGDTFMVASQFNLLEHISPEFGIEHGITRYHNDLTQGPACAIATGAATLYRNYYFQTPEAQVSTFYGFRDYCETVASKWLRLDGPIFTEVNGYAFADPASMPGFNSVLIITEDLANLYMNRMAVGWHTGCDVTGTDHQVDLALCSAYPVSYNEQVDEFPDVHDRLAYLVIRSQYEATFRLVHRKVQQGLSNRLWMTLLGGGAYGVKSEVIWGAIYDAADHVGAEELEVKLISMR